MSLNLGRLLADMQVQLNALADRVGRADRAGVDRPWSGASPDSTDPYAPSVRIDTGVITDVIPFYDCYRVVLEGGGGVVICSRVRQTGTAPTGVTDADTIPAGERVLVLRHRSEVEGYVVGTLPRQVLDRRQMLHDQITQASPDSRSADPYAVDLAARPAADLADRSGGSPLDASAVGEFSRGCAATGTRLHVDPYMTFLRAGEDCGVYAFLGDDCLRLTGRSRQDWHPGGQSVVYPSAAGDSVVCYSGMTPYQWEARGAGLRATPTAVDVPAVESQVTQPYKADAEPIHPDQAGAYRFVKHAGALPAGVRHQVIAPAPVGGLNRYSVPLPCAVLADRHTGLDGREHAVSAGGFELSMRPGLIGHAPSAAPEDLPAVDRPPPPPTPAGLLPDGVGSALAVDDLYAYRQWASGDGFDRAGWTRVGSPVAEAAVSYSDLGRSFTLPDPQPLDRPVYEGVSTKHYPRAAGDAVMPNGTRVIFGPCGEEIRMGGGVLELIAPTVIIRSGRDTVLLSGRDLAVRARRDVDLAAANGAVRQKAEEGFSVLAGNGGSGRLLLESRGGDGITVKTDAALTQYSGSVYARSETGVVSDVVGGDHVLVCRSAVRRLASSAVDYFGPAAEPSAANTYSASGSALAGGLSVTGRVAATEGASFGGSITVIGGHVFTSDAAQYDREIPQLTDTSVDAGDRLNQALTDRQSSAVEAGVSGYARQFTDNLAAENGPASDAGRDSVAFGFRPSDAIGVPGFVLYEGRFQQRARLTGQNLPGWSEPVVIGPRGEPTMPYPGFEVWSSACVRTVDLVLYNPGTGLPAESSAAYASAAYPSPNAATPSQAFTVIG